jgi:hypothetical protein
MKDLSDKAASKIDVSFTHHSDLRVMDHSLSLCPLLSGSCCEVSHFIPSRSRTCFTFSVFNQ